MHARLVTGKMPPGRRYLVEKLAERWSSSVATLPGFVDVWFIIDDEGGEYGLFSLWKTYEDAVSVPVQIGDISAREVMEELLTEPLDTRIFHVYQPRSIG